MFSLPAFLFPQVPFEFIGSRAILQQQDVPVASDYDYLFLEDYRPGVEARLKDLGIVPEVTPSGLLKFVVNLQNKEPGRFYVNGYNCVEINVAFVPNITEYEAWVNATKALRALALLSPQEYKDKPKRLRAFNALVQSFGGDPVTSKYY